MGALGKAPWEGPNYCGGFTKAGMPCSSFEIDGLEFCFQHVPDELLEESEQLTGMRRCRQGPDCRYLAVSGTEPPACINHGANDGSVTAREAARREVERRQMEHFEHLLSDEHAAERLLNPPRIGDPFTELLALASEVKALKDMLRAVVAAMPPKNWRYTGRAGEQYRAEILLYERATERLGQMLIAIVKLNIEDRLAGVEERTMDMIERGMDAALRASGADLDGQQRAREVLRKEIRVLTSA